MHDILIIGGGYAGLWAACSAARQASETGQPLRIALIATTPQFTARVRLYEAGLAPEDARMPLPPLLDAVGVAFLCGDVDGVHAQADGSLRAVTRDGRTLDARAMVLAAGSRVARPAIPGLAEHAFDSDMADAADRTWERLHALAPGAQVDIVGGGFTGIELACELAGWRRRNNPGLHLRLSDAMTIASGYAPEARSAVLDSLAALGVECVERAALAHCEPGSLRFGSGSPRPSDMLIWTAGLVPSPLTAQVAQAFAVPRLEDGRLRVTSQLALPGVAAFFAAGDVAAASVEGSELTTMSCQHALSTGTFAGHNAVHRVRGLPALEFVPPNPYGTCLDLGPAGAMITRGFRRELVAVGVAVKATKQHINRTVIVPPLAGGRAALFAVADVGTPARGAAMPDHPPTQQAATVT